VAAVLQGYGQAGTAVRRPVFAAVAAPTLLFYISPQEANMCSDCPTLVGPYAGLSAYVYARRERHAAAAAQALVQLGPERVAQASHALAVAPGRTSSWDDCFLALAYGEPGALRTCFRHHRPHLSPQTAVAEALGIDPRAALAVVELYDDQVPGGRARLQSLCAEYLELNRKAVVPDGTRWNGQPVTGASGRTGL